MTTPHAKKASKNMNERYTQLVARAGKAGSGKAGKYEAKLAAEDLAMLDAFVKWMKETNEVPSENSRRSYRTYIAKALAEPQLKLTSDQRSAIRKLEKFLAATRK